MSTRRALTEAEYCRMMANREAFKKMGEHQVDMAKYQPFIEIDDHQVQWLVYERRDEAVE